MLRAYIDSFAKKIVGNEKGVVEQASAVKARTEAVKSAEAAMNGAMEESITAQNEWVDADSKVSSLKEQVGGFATTADELVKELRSAKEVLASTVALAARFEALKNRSSAVEEPKLAEE